MKINFIVDAKYTQNKKIYQTHTQNKSFSNEMNLIWEFHTAKKTWKSHLTKVYRICSYFIQWNGMVNIFWLCILFLWWNLFWKRSVWSSSSSSMYSCVDGILDYNILANVFSVHYVVYSIFGCFFVVLWCWCVHVLVGWLFFFLLVSVYISITIKVKKNT